MSRSIAIIGAGIAGLAAGCYGQMNGYETQIFELHDKPGGLCTAWKRKGYTFDGCIHWLVGSRPGTTFNGIWRELGALQGRQIVDHDEFTRIEGGDGKAFIVYTDVDRLQAHMLELAPGDARLIDEMCGVIRRVARSGRPGGPGKSRGPFRRLRELFKMTPMLRAMMKYGRVPVQEFGARFSDPFLREAFLSVFDMEDFPTAAIFLTLAWMHNRNAGYPVGGSLEFARGIERRYLELGGTIHYRSRVDRILVESDGDGHRAAGIRLVDGSEHRADVVISAADGHATLFDMLGDKYTTDELRGYYRELPIFPPIIQVSLGVDRDLSQEPHSLSLTLPTPVTIAGETRRRLAARHFGYDPTMAPEGKSAITTLIPSNYKYWQEISQDAERYEAEKKDAAIKVIDGLNHRFPGLADQVEVVDVATPLTYERYTGNWQGSMEGWLITTKTLGMNRGKGMETTLPALDDFYMAGQWVHPGGGIPTAASSGRDVIEAICKHDGVPFTTKVV